MFRLLIMCLGLLFSNYALALSGKASFQGKTLQLLRFTGENAAVEGGEIKDAHLSGTFTVDLTGLDTGKHWKERNRDMHVVYLQTRCPTDAELKALVEDEVVKKDWKCGQTYKTATFTFDKPVPANGKQKFTGVLELHGTKQPVSGDIDFSGKKIEAEMEIDFTMFGIAQPVLKKLEITLEKLVAVTVELDAP